MDTQSKMAAREEIEVVAVEIDKQPSAGELRGQIEELADRVDALWVLNDNSLVSSDLLKQDYQLYEALNILKGMHLVSRNMTAPEGD